MGRAIAFIIVLNVLPYPLPAQGTQPRISVLTAESLNLIVGFGTGSFAQGDCRGGICQIIPQMLGLGLFGAGLAFLNDDEYGNGMGDPLPLLCWGAGLLISGSSRIYGIYRARRYDDLPRAASPDGTNRSDTCPVQDSVLPIPRRRRS